MTPCREFQGARSKGGYAVVRREGRNWLLHRWIMHLAGVDIDGKVVMHVCDNPACFRFDHLRVGTHSDNTQDMVRKGRARGNTQPNARRKLTTEQATEARASDETCLAAARRLGVHPSAIAQLRRGETYKETLHG